jgi:phosphatidyl-myo-inositol alpha-mannosyltransferase
MRIAIVCPYSLAKPGGVQHQVLCEIRYMTQAGHDVLLVAPDLADAGLIPNESLMFCNLGKTFSVKGNGSVVSLSFPILDLRRVLRQLDQYEVIHMHEPFYPFTSLLLRFTHRPVVATFHAARLVHPFYKWGKVWFASLYRRLASRIGVSALARSTVANHFSPVPTIIPNGIELAKIRPRKNQKAQPYFLFIGRNEPRKGLQILLRAFGAARQKNRTLSLRLIGPGTGDIQLAGVQALGPVDESTKNELLGGALALVAPSLSGESFGIVLLEAMALGVPVIASRLPGYEEVVTHGDTGLLFEPGDHLELQAWIEFSSSQKEQLKLIADAGQVEARRYSWRKIGRRYEAEFRQARDKV